MTLSKKKSETSNNRGCESSLSYSYLMSYCRYVRTMKGKCTPKGGSAYCSRHSPCALSCLLLLFLLVAFCASPLSVRTVSRCQLYKEKCACQLAKLSNNDK